MIPFQEGTVLHVADEALIWKDEQWGTFLPACAQVRSNHATTAQGLVFDYELNYYQMQWGKRVAENWALGANFSYGASDVGFSSGPLGVAETDCQSYNFRFGTVHQLSDRLRWGIVFDYGFAPSRTTLHDFMDTGLGDVVVHDVGYQYLLRPGIAFEYKRDSAIYFDYQLATFFDDTGQLRIHRFFLGVDHQVAKGFFVRSGVALDSFGNTAWGVGVGVYPSDRLTVDLAYQYDMFPELHPELRRSQVVALSVGLVF